jgi:hypothetical protein
MSWACVGRRISIYKTLQEYLKDKPQNVVDFCKHPNVLSEEALRNTRQEVGDRGINLQKEVKQSDALREIEDELLSTGETNLN